MFFIVSIDVRNNYGINWEVSMEVSMYDTSIDVHHKRTHVLYITGVVFWNYFLYACIPTQKNTKKKRHSERRRVFNLCVFGGVGWLTVVTPAGCTVANCSILQVRADGRPPLSGAEHLHSGQLDRAASSALWRRPVPWWHGRPPLAHLTELWPKIKCRARLFFTDTIHS